MENRWIFEGTEKELSEILPLETAKAIMNGFEIYRNLFDDNEFIRSEQIYRKSNIPGVLNFMIPETNYFINLKRASIAVLAFVLDLTLTIGFASAILGLVGYSTQAVIKFDENCAEKCIYISLYKQDDHIGDASVLDATRNQCCSNGSLPCKYRHDSKCAIPEEVVTSAIMSLAEKDIIRKIYNTNCYKCR